MIQKILPATIVAISTVAGIVYYCCGDFKMGSYWVAAALVNFSATFL